MPNRGWGLMWQITNKQQTLREAITEASQYFHRKYKTWPTFITCNPGRMAEAGIDNPQIHGDTMVPASHIHLWGVPRG